MKTSLSIRNIFFILLITCFRSQSQIPKPVPIESYPLEISDSKTSNLIFPYAIKSVDIGSGDVLAQKANGVENILQVKAGLQYFQETNLSVVTSDGQFYSFTVTYSYAPLLLNLSFSRDSSTITTKAQAGTQFRNDEYLKLTASLVNQQPAFLNKKSTSQLLTLKLEGIYVRDGLMWYLFEVQNNSNVDFATESIHFFVKNKRKAKRTAVQEREMLPVFKEGGSVVPGKESRLIVLAFPIFVVGRDKVAVVKITEANSDRLMSLAIQERHILQAKPIK